MPNPNQYPVQPTAIADLIQGLTDILNDPELYTASGKTPKNPAKSLAKLPGVELTTRTGGGMAAGLSDNMLKNPALDPTRMKDVTSQLQKAKIDEMLSKIDLNLPAQVPAPAARMPGIQPLAEIAGRMAPVLTLLDLLTQTTDLNQGEAADLAKRREQPFVDAAGNSILWNPK